MNANKLYKLKPKKETKGLYKLQSFYNSHAPEIKDLYSIRTENNEHVVIKEIARYCFDGRRTWELHTVWFKNSPVMIIQNVGRQGDDHARGFITDR